MDFKPETMFQHENITLLNCDCMDYMATCERFDISICDPPYGIGAAKEKPHNGWVDWGIKQWDNESPSVEYFTELKKNSENQIIWGANHFISKMPFDSSCWLIWDKGQRDFSLADGEMAWTSFDGAMRIFTYSRAKSLQDGKIHPTQKPVALYRWIIKNYVKPNQSILDTHGGSMSIAIAVHEANTIEKMNLKLVVCEKDTDYYNDAVKRFKNHIAQQKINFPL